MRVCRTISQNIKTMQQKIEAWLRQSKYSKNINLSFKNAVIGYKSIVYTASFLFFLLTTFSIILSGCMSKFVMSDQQIADYFAASTQKPTYHTYEINGRKMHYAAIGNDTLPMVLFVHGSPGAWYAFISFLKDSNLYDKARIVAVDRPGFGKSGDGKVEISVQEQAALIKPILETNKSKKMPLLVGHSYGGPVISRLAMDYPSLVGELLIVAGSIDPDLEDNKWYRYVGRSFLVRALLPKALDVSNREIIPLREQLQLMLPLWKNIKLPVTVLQGEQDDLVPPMNAAFAKKMLGDTSILNVIMIPNMNHFIPWRRPDLITDAIKRYLSK